MMGGNLKYWEGSVSVTGSSPAKSGVGYVELTGYDSQLGNLLK
ncbi:MAG TPA: lipocalin family protein [Nitrospiria bacterium]|nr:lipocalin family protein [Nitrospiria bacterium]